VIVEFDRLPLVAVAAEFPNLGAPARKLAAQLGLPCVADSACQHFPYLLVITPKRLELRQQGPGAPGPVSADFVGGRTLHRRRYGGGRRQPLARAVGLMRGHLPEIVDATAGLGRDAFVLACLGCRVHLVERSPIVGALLRDALSRAEADPHIGVLVRERMTLTVADAREYLLCDGSIDAPDVVYLDPMYPRRSKSALPGKEMRFLRGVVGEDHDAPALLEVALSRARQRVVVKRPRLAPSLAGPDPTTRIVSKTTRFDIYVIAALG
jgi:16S rRNA (guanine1516-N2)-methyltransferase